MSIRRQVLQVFFIAIYCGANCNFIFLIMQSYKSRSRKKSGVTAYQAGDDFIIIQFGHSATYKYSYKSAGKSAIEKMKSLAQQQKGLSTFISQAHPAFE